MSKRTTKGDPKVAVSYLRVSTDDQRLGVEAQRASIAAWAAREGVRIVAEHTDEGVSGGSELDERPGLLAALAALKAHGAGVLVVAKRDRIARDTTVAGLIERAATSAGARVISADGVGNGDEPADQFMRSILDAAAAHERAMIRSRTRAALAALKAQGKRCGEVPFGYGIGADGKTLEPNPEEQAIVASILDLHREGLSLRKLAAVLVARGVVSPRSGKPLSSTQVHRLVTRHTEERAA